MDVIIICSFNEIHMPALDYGFPVCIIAATGKCKQNRIIMSELATSNYTVKKY